MYTRTALIAHCATILLLSRGSRHEHQQDEEESVHRAARIVELVEELYPEARQAPHDIKERLVGAEAIAEAARDPYAGERRLSTG